MLQSPTLFLEAGAGHTRGRGGVHSTQHYGADGDAHTRSDGEVTIADGEPRPADDQAPFHRGETLGRYVVLDTLGQGGMGIVLAAYDATLDRRVALKVLRPHASGDPENHARMIREAQALAKLSHPGVVSVYDVGELRGQVFIAMEFIDGPNLRRWCHERKRTPREIIAVFRDAARGLQAAHDAGIVHRDFKPDNVLIGSDGRARVTDFGLALEEHAVVQPPASDSMSVSASSRLTETGMVMGTPAYMPIEQHVGHTTDHRSDQFSFCVSFFEALYGVRPFTGATGNEYCVSIRRGELPTAPSGVKVPRRVHRAILKGLASKPEERHASMRVLLRAITPRTRNRRTWVLGGVGGLAIGAGVVALSDPPERPCTSFDGRIDEVYDRDDKQAIRAAFLDTGLPFAQASFDATTDELDAFAQRWQAAATDACMATERGEQSGQMLDLRMHCLERARSKLGATVDILQNADAHVVREGLSLASRQSELSLCRDLEALQRSTVLPTDAEQEAESKALHAVLDRVETLRAAGRKEDAKMLFAEHQPRIDALEHPPITARALWNQGRLSGSDNDNDRAIEFFQRAHLLALEHGMHGLAAASASSMGFHHLAGHGDTERAEHYSNISLALAKASGSRRVQASVHDNLMSLRFRQSRFDDAVNEAQTALDLSQQGEHPSKLLIAQAQVSVAHAVHRRDGPRAAIELMQDARDYVHEHLGTTHPLLIKVYSQQSSIARELGDYDQAYVHTTAALDQVRSAFGKDSLDEAYELANLATIEGSLGRKREAIALFGEVDRIVTREEGPTAMVRAAVLNNMAGVQSDLEEWDAAIESFNAALEVAKANADGPNDIVLGLHRNLAALMIAQERYGVALGHAEQALEQGLVVFGPEHMDTATTYDLLGRIAAADGDHAKAREYLEHAVKIGHDNAVRAAKFDFELARVLFDDPARTPAEKTRALSLARAAEKTLSGAQDAEYDLEQIRKWLDAHDQGFRPG